MGGWGRIHLGKEVKRLLARERTAWTVSLGRKGFQGSEDHVVSWLPCNPDVKNR